jgi:hypothetical protein
MTIILNGTTGITFPDGQSQDVGVPDPGANGNVLTSNGTIWTSATPPANNALASTFPLKSGASLSAGRVVNMNSSGEVGDYPVVNTLGSVVTNNGGYAYNQFSTDASRALYITGSTPDITNGIYTITIRGMAVTGSSFTNGTTTVTSAINYRGNISQGYYVGASWNIIPINATQFLVFFWAYGAGYNSNETSTYKRRAVAFVVTVDSSGNCTKGNETTIFSRDSPQNEPEGGFSGFTYRFVNNLFGCQVYGGSVGGNLGYYLSVSGTTVTSTQDNDFYNYYGSQRAGGAFGQVTSGGIAVNTDGTNDYGNTLYKATWNGSALGTVTSETLVATANRGKSMLVSPTLLLMVHTDNSNVLSISTFTINQSTGAATLFATRIVDSTIGTVAGIEITLTASSSTQYFTTVSNANRTFGYSFEINSSGDILGTGIRLLTGLTDGYFAVYTGSSNTYRIANTSTKTQNFVVNSYNTTQWNSLGVSQTAQNTSPATIYTDGVVEGFTGLTPGVTYYVNQDTYDGSVTATAGAFPVGTAVSSTKISLGI